MTKNYVSVRDVWPRTPFLGASQKTRFHRTPKVDVLWGAFSKTQFPRTHRAQRDIIILGGLMMKRVRCDPGGGTLQALRIKDG